VHRNDRVWPTGADGQPQVKVTRAGNACGPITSNEPIGVTQTATSDELTVTQRVIVVVVKLALVITLIATKGLFKVALTPRQALVVSVLGLAGFSVWCIVKLIRWRNTKTAVRYEKAWRRNYIEPHSINMG
jgi:hypothetical protein